MIWGSAHAADHALMEVAEDFAAKSGRAARVPLTLMWVQMRIFWLSDTGVRPFGSGLKKFSDRVGKLLIGRGLEFVSWR